jgi:hypothetical protein
MNVVKHFTGSGATQKINGLETGFTPNFIFGVPCQGLKHAHETSQCSLILAAPQSGPRRPLEQAHFVNIMQLCVVGRFNGFLETSIFRARRTGRISEHRNQANFTELHFLESANGNKPEDFIRPLLVEAFVPALPNQPETVKVEFTPGNAPGGAQFDGVQAGGQS